MKLHEYYKSNDPIAKNLPLTLAILITIVLGFGDTIIGLKDGGGILRGLFWTLITSLILFVGRVAKMFLSKSK
jgi:hypothetical protein